MACSTCNTCDSCDNISSYECTCTDSTTCACKITLSALCVIYEGFYLDVLDVNPGENLELILQKINNYFQTIIDLLQAGLVTNIGTGIGSFTSVNAQGQSQLRSFISSDGSIDLATSGSGDEIDITLASGSLGESNTASNVGTGVGPFKQKAGVDLEFLSFVGTGATSITTNAGVTEIIVSSTDTTYTGSNLGAGQTVFNQITGANDFEFKTLIAGTGISITPNGGGTALTFAANGLITDATNLGTGADIFAQVNGTDLEFRSITGGDGITITQSATEIDIAITPVVEQIERSVDFSLDNTMNEQVIFIDNGVNDVEITVPVLDDDFKCGIVQLGSGIVSFTTLGTTLNSNNGDRVIADQYQQAFVQKRNAGTNEFILLGNLVP